MTYVYEPTQQVQADAIGGALLGGICVDTAAGDTAAGAATVLAPELSCQLLRSACWLESISRTAKPLIAL